MTNTNIQGAIPLQGAGFVCKTEGNYRPGEYSRLTNVELTLAGTLANRRAVNVTGGAPFAMANPYPFVGYVGDFAILVSATEHRAVGPLSNSVLWNVANLPVPAGGYHKVAGAFLYNKINYWLTLEYDPNGPVYNVCLYYSNKALETITFADLTRKVIFTGSLIPIINSFFIHKDRLWVCTEDRVYFSKPTDPTIFTVPDGGFFALADTKMKYAFGLGDTIYVLAENSTHVFTYSVDPNSDGYLRTISTSVGGEWGCAHQSSAYLINRSGIYSINNMNLDKVHDTEWDTGENIYQSKLLSFENYLVVIRRLAVDYAGSAQGSPLYWNQQGKVFTPGLASNTLNYNVFFINTDNGATHVMDFTDSNDTAEKGYVVDAMVNPSRDFSGDYRLFFLTNKSLGGLNYQGSTYYMNPERGVASGDTALTSAQVVTKYKPRLCIEIDSYVPDGNEYLMKKFRNLLAMGKYPGKDFGLQVAYDNKALGPVVNLTSVGEGRPHYASRIALNQRARSVTIRLATTNNDVPLVGDYAHFELSDLRTFWSYLKRGPESRVLDK